MENNKDKNCYCNLYLFIYVGGLNIWFNNVCLYFCFYYRFIVIFFLYGLVSENVLGIYEMWLGDCCWVYVYFVDNFIVVLNFYFMFYLILLN